MHFEHPLIAESVTPDTKVRVSDVIVDTDASREEDEIELEAEYAFHPAFSIELGVPYAIAGEDTGFDEIHVAFKFANYAFEQRGLLLGYGLGFGAHLSADSGQVEPGGGHGDAIEPFLNAGLMRGSLELVAFARFEIPTEHEAEHGVAGSDFAYNLSALYHFGRRVQGLMELDGGTPVFEDERDVEVNLSPGIKVRPFVGQRLLVGATFTVPLTAARTFDRRVLVSAFYHF